MSKNHVRHLINSGKMTGRNAAVHEQLVQQETEGLRRLNVGREQVLTRLWEIAKMEPERTRNSMSAQIKALSMIVAIECLIPDRRAGSTQNKSAPPPIDPQSCTDAWLREQQEKTTGAAANAETTPAAPHAPVSASAPEIRVPSSIEKRPDSLRLRL
jgi:hypothetical protein